jgi:hypothetical protein
MMLDMTTDTTFSMGLRAGNWGLYGIMLSIHETVQVQLAPSDRPDVLVHLATGLGSVPRDLTRAELDAVMVNNPQGRAVLRLDSRAGSVERSDADPLLSPGLWELRIQGAKGLVFLYARDDEPVPSDEVLDELAARFTATAPVA